jgi:hypothetical protein
MRRSLCAGGAILCLVLAGCGSRGGASSEEKLAKDFVANLDQVAAAYEKITDPKSFREVDPEIQSLMAQGAELDKQLSALGTDRRQELMKIHAREFDQAMARLKRAKEKAAKFMR